MLNNKPYYVVVINKAGKVGKSTLSKNFIAPMLCADWLQVETFNDSGEGAKQKIAGRKFEFVAKEVYRAKNSLCIDVGNSNYQAAMKELKSLDSFANRIHLWLIPCKESAGVMNDSLATVEDLINNLGVDPRRIVVLPNDIESPEDGLDGFRNIARAAKEFGFQFCEIAIPQESKFDNFNADMRSVFEIAKDETDFDAELDRLAEGEEKERLVQEMHLRDRARGLSGRFRQVWAASLLPVLTST